MVSVEFDPFGFSMKGLATRSIVLRSNSTGDLYPFQSTHGATISYLLVFGTRLSHPGNAILNSLYSSNSIKCNKTPFFVCHSCPLSKHVRLPFVNSQFISTRPFEIIHSDLWTSRVSTLLGKIYYVLFLDHYTNFLWTFPLFHKSQVHNIFVNFNAFVNAQFELKIKSFQCDHGGEFNNKLFHQFCNNRGIYLRYSCPQTSSQNGKSERKICLINNIVCTLLCYASLPLYFWPHALNTSIYLLNILPSKLFGNLTPTHLLFNKSPSYTHLLVFRCLCFTLIASTKIHKLQPRSSSSVFMGYPSSHRGYKCYDLASHKIILSRHVIFDESNFPFARSSTHSPQTYQFLNDPLPTFLYQHTHNNFSSPPSKLLGPLHNLVQQHPHFPLSLSIHLTLLIPNPILHPIHWACLTRSSAYLAYNSPFQPNTISQWPTFPTSSLSIQRNYKKQKWDFQT